MNGGAQGAVGDRRAAVRGANACGAGGRHLAKADTFEDRIRIWGTNCSNCGSQWAHFFFPSAGGLNGYVIQSGDKLYWRQWQGNAARGGTNVWFTDGSSTAYTTLDQDGQPINADTYMNAWHYRRVDLSAHAGKTINNLSVVNEGYNAGFWDIYYQDIALVSADGTVRAIWSRQQTVSLTASPSGGMTGIGYEVNHVSGAGQWPQVTTQYYHGDHLGSSRMMTAYEGYPTWSATYLPFGQEHNPQPTTNHYKFTGKERDSESNLDYFVARYYSSAQGRFLSPDEFAGGPVDAFSSNDPLPPGPLPYADITNPQSLNKYTYTYNNPMRYTDPDGHCPECVGAILGAGVGAAYILYQTYRASQGERPIPTNAEIARALITGAVAGAGAGAAYREANEESPGQQGDQTTDKQPNNPYGPAGKPDHQEGVEKAFQDANSEKGPGENVLREQKLQGHDSNRKPDVQIVGADGKARK